MRYFICLLFLLVSARIFVPEAQRKLAGGATTGDSLKISCPEGALDQPESIAPSRLDWGANAVPVVAPPANLWRPFGTKSSEIVKDSGTKTAAIIKGRIELSNSKLKARGGKLDASGVVVWLSPLDGVAPRKASGQRQVITQRNKRFLPHIVTVEAGSEVDFPNEDPFFHNVFSIFNGRRFDLGLYASGETRPVNFNRPGISYIFCNIHPHMSAVVVSLDTPFFAISDQTGNFTINNLPAGNYRLSVWHERAKPETLATLTRTVQVSTTGLELGVISVSEEGYVPRPHPNKHGQEYDSQNQRPGYRKP